MPREIAPGFHWILECGHDRTGFIDESDPPKWYDPDEEVHIPQCAYFFNDEETLLFDTLSPASRDRTLEVVDELLDGDDLDYIVVSHPDVPHAGNAFRLMEEYPEATLVAPEYGSGHELYHLDEAMHVAEGDSIDLGTYTVDFHEATFLDAALHLWMTERETNTLFPVDWFGYPHTGAECLDFADELDTELSAERLTEFHGRVLFWLQYVDVEKMNAEIDHVIEKFDPDVLAPAHGNPVREDVTKYMEMMKDVTRQINEQGRVGTLG